MVDDDKLCGLVLAAGSVARQELISINRLKINTLAPAAFLIFAPYPDFNSNIRLKRHFVFKFIVLFNGLKTRVILLSVYISSRSSISL